MKIILKILLLLVLSNAFAQTNLIDDSNWAIGSGSITGFSQNGSTAENIREIGTDPYGNQSVLWKAVPDAVSDADGGWNGSYYSINANKKYRFTVWIKKTNSNDGITYFGLNSYSSTAASTLTLGGSVLANSYFWFGDLPSLNQWYLLVGFIHESSYGSTASVGGIYDPISGDKVLNTTDYKFAADANNIRHRAYLYYDTNTSDRQFFYKPTIYEVNGQEPTIQEMLNPSATNNNSGQSLWSQTGPNINYTIGNVGIGTINPTAKLEIYGGGDLLMKGANNDAGDLVFQTNSALQTGRIWSRNDGLSGLYISSGDNTADISISDIGNIGIGINDAGAYKLAVNGNIHAKEVKVDLIGWPDYVFGENYKLPTLDEVEAHIREKGHLINIPSAKEVEENGIQLGEMNKLLLEKIEELTLYIIQLKRENSKIESLEEQLKRQAFKIKQIEDFMNNKN